MLAMFLGLLLSAGVLYIFSSNHATFQVEEGLARTQETSRFLQYYLTREIRMAGYTGCLSLSNITINNLVTDPPDDATFTADTVIQGYEASGSSTWSPALPTVLSSLVQDGTDAITVRFASPLTLQLKNPMNHPNNPLVVDNSRQGIDGGDIIIITDCTVGDMVVAGASSNATAITHTVANNTTNDLSNAYTTEAKVARFTSYHFYLKDTGRQTKTGLPIRALYQMEIDGTETELAEGVEDFQILYGFDSTGDGTADTFANASTIESGGNWSDVKAVRMNLLLSTVEEVNPKEQAYRYNGITVSSPGNKKLHRELQIYTTLRNRAL